MAAPATSYPKRAGYFAPVDRSVAWPGVSLQQGHGVTGAVADVVQEAPELADAAAAAVSGVADGATAYTTWEVSTRTLVLNERGQLVPLTKWFAVSDDTTGRHVTHTT